MVSCKLKESIYTGRDVPVRRIGNLVKKKTVLSALKNKQRN